MVNLNSTSDYIVATLILFINTFCRYSFFYLLTPTRKSKKYNLLFILLTFPVILLINGVGDIIGFFAPFIEIFIFYIVYRQLIMWKVVNARFIFLHNIRCFSIIFYIIYKLLHNGQCDNIRCVIKHF